MASTLCMLLTTVLLAESYVLRPNQPQLQQQAPSVQLPAGSASAVRPPLTRDFVRDIAILAEQLIMYDMPTKAEPIRLPSASRERAAPFFPDRIAEIAERPHSDDCQVRQCRATWWDAICQHRDVRVEEFIDSHVYGTEKAAAVLLWHRGLGDAPTIVVVFRGSKGSIDWLSTNAQFLSPTRRVMRLSDTVYKLANSTRPTEELDSRAERDASSEDPWVTLPVWQAYAGSVGSPVEDSPRARIRRTVDRLLNENSSTPVRHIVVCGHSLGGALAQTCALDLLQSSEAVREVGVTLLPVASPPAFSLGFQRKLNALRDDGLLRMLHLTAVGDFAPKIKGSVFGPFRGKLVHGVTQRLVLSPRDTARPLYYVADGEDDDCIDLGSKLLDQFGHNCYAKDLSSMVTPQRPLTIPPKFEWPVPSSV